MFRFPLRFLKIKNISVSSKSLASIAVVMGLMAGSAAGANAQTASQNDTRVSNDGATVHPTAGASVLKLYGKSYGDWVYECVRVVPSGAVSPVKCFINQRIVVTQNGQQVPWMTIMLAKATGQSDDLVNLVVPLGIMLPPGIDLWSDENAPVALPVNFCTSNGCVVIPQSADGLEKQLKVGQNGHARLTLVNGHTVTANFALTGFGAALTALNSGQLPPEIKMPAGTSTQKSSRT